MKTMFTQSGSNNHHASGLLVSALLLAGGATLFTGCPQEEPEPTLAKEGEMCQVAADCESGLTCRSQVCTPLNVPDDMGSDSDMGMDGDMDGEDDMTPVVEDEEFVISFLRKKKTGEERDNTYMYTVNTKSLDVVRASDDAAVCSYSCWVSDDLTSLVYLRPTAGQTQRFDVYAATLNDGRQVEGEGSAIASDVEKVFFTGDAVSFSRSNVAYYLKLGTTEEVEVAMLSAQASSTQDSWTFDIANELAVVFSPTLNKLNVRLGELGTPVIEDDSIYTIDSSNYQMTSGAYFGSNIPSAISPDGRYLAILTDAPNNYGICDTNADCDAAAGQHCGEQGLCTVREITLHTFDLQNLDELPNGSEQAGKQCTDDSECSAAHECYIPAITQLDKARCIPRRTPLGLQSGLKQPRVVDAGVTQATGCELTAGADIRRYTDINTPMVFDQSNTLYVTAARDCGAIVAGERNMPDSDILAINPEGGAVSVVTGSENQDFDAERCYDTTENKIDVTDCVIYIAQAVLSPGGNEFAVLATNPDVQDPSLAASVLDVWTILKDGSKREWVGQGTLFEEGRRVSTHEAK